MKRNKTGCLFSFIRNLYKQFINHWDHDLISEIFFKVTICWPHKTLSHCFLQSKFGLKLFLSAIDFSYVPPCVYLDASIHIFKQHDGVEYITSFRHLVSEYISHTRGLAIVVIYFKNLAHMLISHQSETCTLCNNLGQKIYQYRVRHMPGRAFVSYVLVTLLCLDK